MGYILVALFFFFSGYGLSQKYKKDGEKYSKNFLLKRLPSLIIPFFISSTILYVFTRLTTDTISIKSFIKSFVNLKPFDGICWYVYIALFSYIVFYIFMKTTKSLKIILIENVIVCLGIFSFCIYTKKIDYWWWISLGGFPLGIAFSIYGQEILKYAGKKWMRLLCISIVGFIITYKIVTPYMYRSTCKSLILENIPILFLIASILLISMRYEAKSSLLEKNGKMSYELYLAQSLSFAILKYFMPAQIVSPTLYFITLILCIGVYAYILNKINEFVLGKYKKLLKRFEEKTT